MIDLHSLANSATAWAIRYLVVSTPLLILLLAAARIFPRLPHRLLDYMWKGTLVGSLVIATLIGIEFQRPAIATFEVSLPGPAPAVVESDVPITAGAEKSVEHQSSANIQTSSQPMHWPSIITLLWLSGALAGLSLFSIRRALLYRRIGKRVPVLDERLRTTISRLQSEAGITRPLYVSSSRNLFSPIAIGSSEICLPEQAIIWAKDDEFEGMIAHELAHLVRHDPFWLTLWNISISALFFQPLLLLARRRFQATAEYLCDSWAIRHTQRPEALVRCLVSVAEGFKTGAEHRLAVGMASSKRTLLDRARAALEERHDNIRSKAVLWATVAVATLFGAALVSPAINFGTERPETHANLLDESISQANVFGRGSQEDIESVETNTTESAAQKSHSFIIHFNDLLRYLIEADSDSMSNPRPGETAQGVWRGNHHEIWDDFSYRAEIEGVVLSDDEQRIHRIEPGGYLKFKIEADNKTYKLEITPEGDRLVRRFWINATRTEFKGSHRAEMLVLLDKAIGLVHPDETPPAEPTPPTRSVRPTKSVHRLSSPPTPNVYYSTGNGGDAFVIYYNELMRNLFDPANDRQLNPLPQESSGGKWSGGMSETQEPWNYRVRFRGVVLTDDNARIHHIEPIGYFRFTINIDDHTYKLEVTPTGQGELQRRFWRDQKEKVLLADDQQELLDILDKLVAFSLERDKEKAKSGSGINSR